MFCRDKARGKKKNEKTRLLESVHSLRRSTVNSKQNSFGYTMLNDIQHTLRNERPNTEIVPNSNVNVKKKNNSRTNYTYCRTISLTRSRKHERVLRRAQGRLYAVDHGPNVRVFCTSCEIRLPDGLRAKKRKKKKSPITFTGTAIENRFCAAIILYYNARPKRGSLNYKTRAMHAKARVRKCVRFFFPP